MCKRCFSLLRYLVARCVRATPQKRKKSPTMDRPWQKNVMLSSIPLHMHSRRQLCSETCPKATNTRHKILSAIVATPVVVKMAFRAISMLAALWAGLSLFNFAGAYDGGEEGRYMMQKCMTSQMNYTYALGKFGSGNSCSAAGACKFCTRTTDFLSVFNESTL